MMKFTLAWLKEHLDTDRPLGELADKLTMIGLEVERIEDKAKLFAPFTVARVIEAKQHPNADRLRVCMVDTGAGDPVQVVCGAPNARTGMKSVFAPPGAFIPGKNITLGIGKIRDVESRGMLVSEFELQISDNHEGIIDLPDDAPVGEPYAKYAGLDDPVLEINLTPNRADATGVHGIARDLAAADMGKFKDPGIKPVKGEFPCPVKVSLDFGATPSLCPGFALRLVRGVKNGPSPDWLQKRLIAIGLAADQCAGRYHQFHDLRPRPAAACVRRRESARQSDGAARSRRRIAAGARRQDLRARRFDLRDRRRPRRRIARRHHGRRSLGLLGSDHRRADRVGACGSRSISPRPGASSASIRTPATASSAASIRPSWCRAWNWRPTWCSSFAAARRRSSPSRAVPKRPNASSIFRRTSSSASPASTCSLTEMRRVLERLGFFVAGQGERVKIAVPSWRPDVQGKADIVEEVVRIVGVDRVPLTPFPRGAAQRKPVLTPIQVRTRKAKRALAARNLIEAVTWSFIAKKHAELFGGGKPELALANPIAADLSDMRPSLIPGLVAAAQKNADRGFPDAGLFEVGQIFRGDQPADQFTAAAGMRRALAKPSGIGRHWQKRDGEVDAFDAKADALTVLTAAGAAAASAASGAGRTGLVSSRPLRHHPDRPAKRARLFRRVASERARSARCRRSAGRFRSHSRAHSGAEGEADARQARARTVAFQPVERDFAFVVERSVKAADIVRAAQSADRKLIAGVSVFDVYEGKGIEPGKKSIAIAVTLQPRDKTMTDAEIEALAAKIVAEVGKRTGGVLRA